MLSEWHYTPVSAFGNIKPISNIKCGCHSSLLFFILMWFLPFTTDYFLVTEFYEKKILARNHEVISLSDFCIMSSYRILLLFFSLNRCIPRYQSLGGVKSRLGQMSCRCVSDQKNLLTAVLFGKWNYCAMYSIWQMLLKRGTKLLGLTIFLRIILVQLF